MPSRHPLLSALFLFASCSLSALAADAIKLVPSADRVRIEIDGGLFTEYIFRGAARPYLYPVIASDGTPLSRDYPMKTTAGEETDHPHHRSLWFTHGAVNGIDFWTEGPGKGHIVSQSVQSSIVDNVGEIRARNQWLGPDGKIFCTDETTIRVRGSGENRFLDYDVALAAPADQAVTLGDTKEGSMAIRLPLWMTPTHRFGKAEVPGSGTIVNDQGVRDAATWGKRSTWVDYHAPRNGKTYGVAILDHPSNPRYPTWWHVRDYGLFAANPFGQHDFEGTKEKPLPANLGDLVIPAGGTVRFRYRFYFHSGDERAAKVAEQAKAYAGEK